MAGRYPLDWIEMAVDRCALVYGEAPCTAGLGVTGGRKCFNGWATCQDPDNFDPEPYWLRFAMPTSDLPRLPEFTDDGLPYWLPLVQDIRHSPVRPDPGRSIGVRSELRITLQDAPYHDIAIDKYALERKSGEAQLDEGPYDPARRSTLWAKLLIRFPHYIGRRLRWHRGYVDGGASVTREYIVEQISGPDRQGRIEITAKDPLKLADTVRAQCPRPSRGRLAVALPDSGAITQIDVTTPDVTEYDGGSRLEGTLAFDATVFIGREGFNYTGTTVLNAQTVRLTGVVRGGLPGQYVTTPAAHSVGDAVQLGRFYNHRLVHVVHDLLTNFVPGFDPAWIDLAAWLTEHDTWFGEQTIRRMIPEPEGVVDLINEIVEQTLTWGFWWDEAAQQVRYRGVRPPDTGESVPRFTDDLHLAADSVERVDEPDRVVNEVQVIFGQLDPTRRRDEDANYSNAAVRADLDSQSGRELGQRRVRRLHARWHPDLNLANIEQYLTRTIAQLARAPSRFSFEVTRQDGEQLHMGQFCWLETDRIVDDAGRVRPARVQVVRAGADGDLIRFEGREDIFSGIPRVFGRLAPQGLTGLLHANASSVQLDRYFFLADANGEMADSTPGYRLL